MPIKRLQRPAQFPCLGKLRKGAEKVNDRKPGADLTYFRFDTKDDHAKTMFEAAYGDEPSEVGVFLPHPTTDRNFDVWQEHWTASSLQHRCDGETCTIWLKRDGTYSQEPKPCPGGCKEVGRLMVILPVLQRFAYVTVETHSINDIIRLTEQLQAVESLRGTLQSIPFVLRRTPVEISTPSGSNGKRARREKWLLSIEVAPEWAAMQLSEMQNNALGASTTVPLLEYFGEDDTIVGSLDEVPDMDPRGPVDGDTEWEDIPAAQPKQAKTKVTSAFINLQGTIKALFPKDTDDARHWLVEQYTSKATPDNVRKSSKDLDDKEMRVIAKALNSKPDEYQTRYTDYIEAETKAQEGSKPQVTKG